MTYLREEKQRRKEDESKERGGGGRKDYVAFDQSILFMTGEERGGGDLW